MRWIVMCGVVSHGLLAVRAPRYTITDYEYDCDAYLTARIHDAILPHLYM